MAGNNVDMEFITTVVIIVFLYISEFHPRLSYFLLSRRHGSMVSTVNSATRVSQLRHLLLSLHRSCCTKRDLDWAIRYRFIRQSTYTPYKFFSV